MNKLKEVKLTTTNPNPSLFKDSLGEPLSHDSKYYVIGEEFAHPTWDEKERIRFTNDSNEVLQFSKTQFKLMFCKSGPSIIKI